MQCEGDNDEWKSAITWVGVVDEQKTLLDDDYTIIFNNATAFASTAADHKDEVLRVPVSTSHADFMAAWKSGGSLISLLYLSVDPTNLPSQSGPSLVQRTGTPQ